LVQGDGSIPHLCGDVFAEQRLATLEVDILVVLANRRLGGWGENGFRKAVGQLHPIR